jgi:hypothetical protein
LKTATKKISSLFFILLGFTPLLFILFVTLKKKEIRHRMEEELRVRELVTVVIPESEVIWMDDHEIWANNSMFDIQTKKLENGIYTFTGLYDAEETLLVEQERKEAGKAKEQCKLLSQLFKHLPVFCIQQDENSSTLSKHDNYWNWLSTNPVSQFREILTPPPQAG